MSAVASPIVVLVYPFRHLTVGPLEQRKRNCYIVIVSTKTFVQFRVGRVDIYIHSRETDLNVIRIGSRSKLESAGNLFRKFSVAGFELTLAVPVLADNSGVDRARRYS